MAIQSDGKILLACYMGSGSAVDEVVMRLTSSGAIDTTYGGGTGQRVIDFGGLDLPLRMVLDSSGRAVVAGTTDLGDATLFRLTTSGDLDTTFSTDGKMLVDFGGSADEGSGVAIDSAGGIIIGGTGGANDDLVVARILSDGTIDTTFGTSGFAYASFGPGADEGEDLAIDSTGKIVIGGTADGNLAMAVARFNADGTPDVTFGTNGKVRIDFYGDSTYEDAEAMTLQSDDKIVIAGQVGTDFAVARLNAVTTSTKTRLYIQQDANYNVTSITDDMGGVLERYRYDPYGGVTVLNEDWTTRTGGTNYDQHYLYQGERYDAEAGLYHMNARDYDPMLGRWVQQDPSGYVDSDDLYEFAQSGPIARTDPTGLSAGATTIPSGYPGAPTGCVGGASAVLKSYSNWAGTVAMMLYPGARSSPKQNAMRHCIRACQMTLACGAAATKNVLDQREDFLHRWFKPCDTIRDNNNNAIGINRAAKNAPALEAKQAATLTSLAALLHVSPSSLGSTKGSGCVAACQRELANKILNTANCSDCDSPLANAVSDYVKG